MGVFIVFIRYVSKDNIRAFFFISLLLFFLYHIFGKGLTAGKNEKVDSLHVTAKQICKVEAIFVYLFHIDLKITIQTVICYPKFCVQAAVAILPQILLTL